MSWFTEMLTSTIGRKLIMALTGLFLILFLVVHLAGNLQLLFPDGGRAFNIYSENMGSNPLIRIVSILNFGFILLHIWVSVLLSRQNKKARPVPYAAADASANSTWASRNMGILGSLILIFLIVHLRGFWFEFKFGEVPMVSIDGEAYKDTYSVVTAAYSQLWYVAVYIVSMIILAFHLHHGFASAFQTLGLNHPKYTPFIKKLGAAFCILVPAGFALIPIVLFMKTLL
jgi:succinate dehydrogenase / fumarate reductase, cytochrome b subunit